MGFYEKLSAIASLISFIAIFCYIIQYTKKRELSKDLFQMVQTQYNNYYLIARAVTRLKNIDKSEIQNIEALQRFYESEMSFINGVSDSARIQLMNFSKNQLKKEVSYQHPAYPGKTQFSDEVKMGLPPESEKHS